MLRSSNLCFTSLDLSSKFTRRKTTKVDTGADSKNLSVLTLVH